MYRFENDRFYRTSDEALAVIGTRGTLAQWRHRSIGPPYHKLGTGGRVIYKGSDLNAFLDKHKIEPKAEKADN